LIGGGARPVDAVAAARAALSPADEILHLRVVYETDGLRQSRFVAEQWTAASPTRWRIVQGPVGSGQRQEMSYADGVHTTYTAPVNVAVLQEVDDEDSLARVPSVMEFAGVTDLRSLLASGALRDAGEVRVGDRTVRRLIGERLLDEGTLGGITRELTYDVDPDTFAPLQGSIAYPGKESPLVRFTVERYERLPITPETERLLAVDVPADAKVDRYTAEDVRRRREAEREWRASCKPRKGGDIECPAPPHDLAPVRPAPRADGR
jgi:hypothetical protein